MKFTIERHQLIKPLQQITGSLGGRTALPILNNLLIKVEDGYLSITATDLEVELIGRLALTQDYEAGSITVTARKFYDICRSLPENALIQVILENQRIVIKAGRSHFSLATLPAQEFPSIEQWESECEVSLSQEQLLRLIESTQFSMANQDVRYFLNGMLFDITERELVCVATDGHRMALASMELSTSLTPRQIIVPRKGVQELTKLLSHTTESVTLQIGTANLRVAVGQFVFTTKLIDGRFPDYQRVLPKQANKFLIVEGDMLRSALQRAAILSNEKFRSIRVLLETNQLRIIAKNPEQEEAEELLDVDYQDESIEIGFNVNYVLDVLNTLKCEQVRFSMTDANTSTLIENTLDDSVKYVVMPVRL